MAAVAVEVLAKGTLLGLLKSLCPHCAAHQEHPVVANGSHRQLLCAFCGEHITFVPRKTVLLPVPTAAAADPALSLREKIALQFAVGRLSTSESDEPSDAEIHAALDLADRAAGIFLARRKGA